MDKETIKKISENISRAKLPFDIIGIAAFGSRVKDNYTEDSDMDLLVTASGLPLKRHRRGTESANLKRILPIIPLDILLLTKEETISNFRNHNPLFLDIATEGIVLLDSNNFLTNIIAETQNYLRNSKIQKIEGGWVFPVKPSVPTFLSKISNLDFSNAMFKDGERDFEIGKTLRDSGYFDKSVYHFQQAIEKYIKAVLIAKGVFKKTHFIGNELRLLIERGDFEEKWKDQLLDAAQISEEIEPEVSLSRYPGISGDELWLPYEEYEDTDAAAALHKAEKVKSVSAAFITGWFAKKKE